MLAEMGKVVVGQQDVVEELLITLFAGGHNLLEGVPGLAKTLMINTLARLVSLHFKRIQFTPDLMPADITGTNVFDPRVQTFQFRQGPIFAEFLWEQYADETMASQPAFDSLAEFSERKELTPKTRQALIDGAYSLVSLRGDETPTRGQRLALTMCRVLLMPDAADLHENLIGTYLPNLLGITSGLPPQPASKVFEDREPDRKAVEAFLQQHGTDADATPLLTWIRIK